MMGTFRHRVTERSSVRPRSRDILVLEEEHHEARYTSINSDVSPLRYGKDRNDANRCLSVFLRVQPLSYCAASEVRRLLRVLLVRVRTVPASAAGQVLLQLNADEGLLFILGRI